MPNLIPAVFSWSGGKDSMLALHYILQEQKYEVRYLMTTVNQEFGRVAMHGVREELLIKQAESLNIPLVKLAMPEMPTMEAYEVMMDEALLRFKNEGIDHIIFGDIFLEDLKRFRELQVQRAGMLAVFPLWAKQSDALIAEFVNKGYRTMVVCAQNGLQDFCGRVIDDNFISDLPEGIDPCGENGEFHTFVFDGPKFERPIAFEIGDLVYKSFPKPNKSDEETGYWYIDLL
ncbi:MAG: diphthine--ammonia ligase [Flavobacteriales bacterium]|nr:MAG: diphthine--ammonia ligase [Flavobacteriales bacterium]